jgi:hypothetical protein
MILQNCIDVTMALNEVSDMRKQDVVQIEKNKKMPKIARFVRNYESHKIASD